MLASQMKRASDQRQLDRLAAAAVLSIVKSVVKMAQWMRL